jgi:adenylate kinase
VTGDASRITHHGLAALICKTWSASKLAHSKGNKMRIVLLGGPGVGKGTQSQILAEKYNVPHIATGDILRQAVKDGTEMGLKAKSYMDKGLLVPDDVVIGIIEDRLTQSDAKFGMILDGFPRTVPQAEALDELTARMDMSLDAVVYIKAPADIIVQRLSGRRTCRDCQTVYHIEHSPPKEPGVCDRCGGELYQRDDDKEQTIRKRLEVYESQTSPLLDYYRKAGKLSEVSGEGTIENVNVEICRILSSPRTRGSARTE